MIATVNTKFSGGVWIFSFLNILDVGAIYADGDIVFRFTCDRARMASNAGPIVYYKSEIYHIDSSSARLANSIKGFCMLTVWTCDCIACFSWFWNFHD
jgi:hypothetical protein